MDDYLFKYFFTLEPLGLSDAPLNYIQHDNLNIGILCIKIEEQALKL